MNVVNTDNIRYCEGLEVYAHVCIDIALHIWLNNYCIMLTEFQEVNPMVSCRATNRFLYVQQPHKYDSRIMDDLKTANVQRSKMRLSFFS